MTRLETLNRAFRAARALEGEDRPEDCPACVWCEDIVAKHPKWTVAEFVAELEREIAAGRAHHGWIKDGLRFAWKRLTSKERIVYFEALARGGVHKSLLNKAKFPEPFTKAEARALEAILVDSRQHKAVERLKSRMAENG